MKVVTAGEILDIKTGKYDANHASLNGKYRFFTCAMESSMADTFAFDDEVLILPGNGANVGEVFYYKGKLEAYQRTYVLHNISQNTKYLYYYFKKNWIRQITKRQVGSATNYIKMDDIVSFEIPLPPLEQQQKIASILDAADTLRQKDKALLAKYDELTQSLFLDMFGDPVSNPKRWEKIKLEKINNISSGSTPSRDVPSYYDGNIPWVKTGEVNGTLIYQTSEKISIEAIKNSSCKLYPKGSIIIAMYGQGKTRGQIGVLGIEASTNQACGVLPPSDKINFRFLFNLLQMSYDDLRSLGRGGNQPNLNSGILKKYEVINPPLLLQTQFVERVAIIEQQKAQVQVSMEKSEELFNSLLQKAFKGELV